MIWLWGGVALLLAIGALWVTARECGRWIQAQVARSLKTAQDELVGLAAQQLALERAKARGELDVRKEAVDQTVRALEQQLAKYEQHLRELERDRAAKYGALQEHLEQAAAETQKLRVTTVQLASMLGNAKVRGQWGEKAAEDILRLCGLQEGIHYETQKQAPLGRPDVTFKLPQGQRCYMDVKFPLDNFVKLVNAERDEERRALREQFLRDVRGHMKELERRDYASGGAGQPDYILMFIPNEQVYGAINEWMPGLIDEGLRKRIILCGPWTLYAQIRVIWDAWQTHYHAQTVGEVMKIVSDFLGAFRRFKDRFAELGKKLADAMERHQDIARIDYAQLERKVEQIERYRAGQASEAAGSLPAASEGATAELLSADTKEGPS